VACINSINGALSKVPGVVSAQSQLHPLGMKGGSATVVFDSSYAAQGSVAAYQELTEAVFNAGFEGASVESVRKLST